MSNFTPEDLLQYYYKELPLESMKLISEALQNNWALKQKYNVIIEAARRLDNSIRPPRKESVDAILKYAEEKIATDIKQ